MENKASSEQNDVIAVPWPDIVRFVRQLSHDLRNDLNAAELQAAYLDEITTDAELKTELRRLREMVARTATNLQKLSARVAQPQPQFIPYRASELLEDLRAKIEHDATENAAAVEWEIPRGDAVLNVDPQLLQEAFGELFANAFRHGREAQPLLASGKIDNQTFIFTLAEPKSGFDASTTNWGREPLHALTPGHYGLGLHRTRNIIEAHGGQLRAEHDDTTSTLRTTVTLPVVANGGENVVK